jgi:Zn finger protein HypA/HybF involved in hydrogenase expression
MEMFERYSVDTCKELIAEVKSLRAKLTYSPFEHSHQCKKCLHPYTPNKGESENCPVCGYDGT